MTSSVNAVKWKSDGIYGIFGVTVLRLLPELNRRAMGTRCIVCILFEIRHLVFWQRNRRECTMCEPASHARQTCEALENTLVRLNSTPVSLNSTSVSLQLALR